MLQRLKRFAAIFVLCGMALLGCSANSSANDWPRFRGPNGQAKSSETGLPTEWSPDQNIAWKRKLPGGGTSSPIVYRDSIYLTCYSGYGVPREPRGEMRDLRLHVVCLNRQDGKLAWQRELRPRLPEQESIREGHGYASGTPVADEQHVYCFFGKTGVFAFTHEGRPVWHTTVGDGLNGWGSATSPVLYEDLVIVNASVESDSLVALDRQTGKQRWKLGGIRESWNTPIIVRSPSGKSELVVAIFGKILGVDPATGKQLWSCDTDIRWYMAPSLVTEEGVIFSVGGRTGGSLAVRSGGRGDVTSSHRLWTRNKGSNVPSPILHEGHLYWMHEKLGIAYCAKAATGEILYEERLPRAGQVYASPVLADGNIYYFARNGRAFVVAAAPEFRLVARSDALEPRGRFDASPAVVDRGLLIRSHTYLYFIRR